MNKIIYLIYLLLLCNTAFSQVTDSLTFVSLKPSEFREEMHIVNNPVVVDVREFFEFRKSRLPGAINIASSGNIEASVDTIDKATHLFFYCTSGYRSKRMAQKFAEKGFIHVYNLDGGIGDWKKEGFPVERKKVRRRNAGC